MPISRRSLFGVLAAAPAAAVGMVALPAKGESGAIKHEGHGGWNVARYVTTDSDGNWVIEWPYNRQGDWRAR